MGTYANWGGGDGDWFNGGNWTEPNPDGNTPLHYVPGATNDAIFNGTTAYTVTFNGPDRSVEGVSTDDFLITLDIAGGSLSVGNDGGSFGLLTVAAGATFAISDSFSFRIVGNIDNAGVIQLNVDGGDVTQLTLGLQTTLSPVTLSGGGSVTMSDAASNSIFIDNDASLDNVDNTISGAGTISTNFETMTNEAMGVIKGTGALNALTLSGIGITNKGLIEDTGAGGLAFTSNYNNTSINNQGGTISAAGAGAHVDLDNGTSIAGGTLSSSGGGIFLVNGSASFDGETDGVLTIAAGVVIKLDDGASLTLAGAAANGGGIVNKGEIDLNGVSATTRIVVSEASTSTPLTLSGGGSIKMSDSANNQIGLGNVSILDNIDNTISGAGEIGANFTSMTNEAKGVIDATGATNKLDLFLPGVTNLGLIEDTGAAGLQISDGVITNTGGIISADGMGAHVDFAYHFGPPTVIGGTLTTSNGGLLNLDSSLTLQGAVTISGTVDGAGQLEVNAGDTTFSSGATLTNATLRIDNGAQAEIATPLTYAGAFNNSGTVTLDGASTFELSGSVGYSGAINFAAGASATLTLDAAALANGQTFADAIGGLGAGDVIDLSGLAFAGNVTPTYDSASGTLGVTEGGVTDTLVLTAPGSTNFALQADKSGGTEIVVCFASGTRIRTVRGDVAVERLAIGDHVVAASGERRPVRWLGHRRIDCRSHRLRQDVLPVRIGAHALGENRPARDLIVSPGHSIAVDILGEVLIPAIALVNGATIQQIEVDEITYWHVELDSHDLVLAENLAAESYLEMGNRSFFGEARVVDRHAAPDPRPSPHKHSDFCRPYHDGGPLVEAVRAQLHRRALGLGWALSEALDLHLEIDGRRIYPVMDGMTARFPLPANAADAWLVSPTARPRETTGAYDLRDLGVCVSALSISGGDAQPQAIALDDPRLAEGFHSVEDGVRRWTDGKAKLPAALWRDRGKASTLTVDLAGAPAPRWVAPEGCAAAAMRAA